MPGGWRGISTLGIHAHGRRTRAGHQLVEWALGEGLRFLLSFTRQGCRDTWSHPKSHTGHPIDHLLCRGGDQKFLGASKVLFEDQVDASWSAYTDHNPIEVKLAKGWVFRYQGRSLSKQVRRPNWVALRGVGPAVTTAREALAAEMDRRCQLDAPSSWTEVVDLGIGVARAVLGEETKKDPRPWVRGCEATLLDLDQQVSRAASRKRAAEDEVTEREAGYEMRRCKRRRAAWLRAQEVEWWNRQAQLVQDKADQGDSFGVFATFRELRTRSSSVPFGDVKPKEAQEERDAWADHFRRIGAGAGFVEDKVWEHIPTHSPMDLVWGDAPAPNELHAALRQMSLGQSGWG